jgi:hypothetical protein
MANQLIPSPELAPPSVGHLPLEKRIELWAEMVDEADALVLSGLRAEIGPDGDLQAAYRAWYARHMEEHDRMLTAFATRLSRQGSTHGK